MESPRRFSAISMAILEYLIQQTSPKDLKQIRPHLKESFRAKAGFNLSPMVREGLITPKDIGEERPGYSITRKGRDIVAHKSQLDLVEAVAAAARPHPDTGEPISVHHHGKLMKERGETQPRAKKPKPEASGGALPNVSTNANNLMDNISQVIQENMAYREALVNIGNQVAALLGMRMMPRE